MKKKIFTLLLVFIILCFTMTSTAFAENMTSWETSVSYTVNSSYVINIPASVNLNETPYLTITASSMNTKWGQRVSVFIDASLTYENGGNFYLYKDKGTENEKKIKCDLYRNGVYANGLDFEVARFDDGSTTNFYNELEFRPSVSSSTPPGTYTGTIYFKITLS